MLLVAAPLVALALATVLAVAISYLAEYRERRRMAEVNALLEEKVRERTRELHDTQLEVIQRLGQAVEWRDEETGDHVERMSALCYRLGRAAGHGRDARPRCSSAPRRSTTSARSASPTRCCERPGRSTPTSGS